MSRESSTGGGVEDLRCTKLSQMHGGVVAGHFFFSGDSAGAETSRWFESCLVSTNDAKRSAHMIIDEIIILSHCA